MERSYSALFSEWFRIGGLHDFIGLHDFELFGRQVIKANLEYRYLLPIQIISDIYLALRYDIGAIWENPDLVMKSEDFFSGIGGWIGINTILGPLYIGYGDTSHKTNIWSTHWKVFLGFPSDCGILLCLNWV